MSSVLWPPTGGLNDAVQVTARPSCDTERDSARAGRPHVQTPGPFLFPPSGGTGQRLSLQLPSTRLMAASPSPPPLGLGGPVAEARTARGSRSLAQMASDSGEEGPQGQMGRERASGTSQPQAERQQVRGVPDSGHCQAGSHRSLSCGLRGEWPSLFPALQALSEGQPAAALLASGGARSAPGGQLSGHSKGLSQGNWPHDK